MFLMLAPDDSKHKSIPGILEQFAFGCVADKFWKYWFGVTNFEEERKKLISKALNKIPNLLLSAGNQQFELKIPAAFDLTTNIVTMQVQKKDHSAFTTTDKENLHTLFDRDFYSDLYEDGSQLTNSIHLSSSNSKFTLFFFFDYLKPIEPIC
jgi:hypothetical protein